ncbi:hypothetical protein RM572_10750 [Streptomyces sp. DSM 42041]|uniref:ABC transporter n=1 Tax=Streptomyces hazeniae TaxID=3075538 RepID=A0ABU2NQJ8_9ACTN|nr:hypothetical protein [Streptomyces sp. DSM 42041]MDT0379244.1 hypothetical protein [Streptomyces sp. DSM 42041]
MNTPHPCRLRHPRSPAACAVLGLALLTGCGGQPASEPEAAPDTSTTPHGYVEGAQETQEAQSRLVLAESGTGATRVLDLITEKVTTVATSSDGVRDVLSDGRFAYVSTGARTRVVDGGGWTVDHGDHVHYYRAAVRELGTLDGSSAGVGTDAGATVITRTDGTALLLKRAVLEDGALGNPTPLTETSGPVVPHARHLIVSGAGEDGSAVEIRDRENNKVTTLANSCESASGHGRTRAGVVLGCRDGALLVSEEGGEFDSERIPYPNAVSTGQRARDFTQRAGSSTLVALAGEDGVWQLDVEERAWKRFETGPVVAANSAGAGTDLLALAPDGELTSYDAQSGKKTASRRLLAEVPDGVRIEVDASRAYVNDPAAKKIHEIDYNDRLREARTFALDFAPDHMAETGR